MQYRFVKEKDIEQAIFIISQAFYYDCESEYKLVEKGKFHYEEFLGAFEGDDMAATLQLIPNYMWLNGKSVNSAGIANIATLAEYRYEGIVADMMKIALDKMYKDGCVTSLLYPFSYPFYRKFGYELCTELSNLEVSPERLSDMKFKGSAKQFLPGEDGTDPGDIIEIYNEFAAKYNVMLDRDAWQWEVKLEHDPVQSKIRTYIIYDMQENPVSYFIYKYDRHGFTADLSITDLAWKNTDGMKMLFAFIGQLAVNVDKIDFSVPPDFLPSYIWENPREYKIQKKPSGMVRIINAEKALATLNGKGLSGSFTIKVKDPQIEHNNKSFKVNFIDNKAMVAEFSGDCDVECSIMALAQMITGFAGLTQISVRDDVKIHSNHKLLSTIFTQKMIYIADFF